MNISLTPELEKFVEEKVASGLYNNASEVIREGLRLLKEHDEIRMNWREQIERGWLQAQAGQIVDGEEVLREAAERIKQRGRNRADLSVHLHLTAEALHDSLRATDVDDRTPIGYGCCSGNEPHLL
jgi:antitoxin ParD1/3/4